MDATTSDLLRSCLDHVNESFFVVDPATGEFVDVNKHTCDMLGYSRDELMGMNPGDVSESFPDTMSWPQHVEEVKQQGSVSVFTNHIHRDGHRIPVEVDVDYVQLEDREFLVASAREIESEEVASNPRYKSQARYSSVFEDAPIALWELDFAGVKQHLEELPERARQNPSKYLSNHPEVIENCLDTISVKNVNKRAVEIYDANDKDQLVEHFYDRLEANGHENMMELLVRFLKGESEVRYSTWTKTVEGEEIKIDQRLIIPPAHRDDLGTVFISFRDVTEEARNWNQLARREAKFRSLLGNLPGIAYECEMDSNWTMNFISDNVEEITGYAPEAFINNNRLAYADVIHPNDRQRVEDTVIEAVENRESFEIEYRVQHKNGDVRWVMERGEAEFDSDENVDHLHGFILDITHRKRAQQELSEREKLLDTLISNVPGVVFRERIENDFEEWTMEYISESAEQVIGYSPGEFLEEGSVSYGELVHPDDLNDVIESVKTSAENGDVFEIEYRIERKDGEIRWVFERGQIIENEQGEQYLHGVIIDINDRVEAQQKLEESERRFRSTFEQAAVGIAHVDLDGSFLRVNEKFCDLLGYTEEEMLEMDFQSLTHPDDLERDLEHVERLIEGEEKQYSIEKRYFRKDDSILWVNLTVGIVRNEGPEQDYFVSVIEDITDRKQAEQELAESEQRFRHLAENLEEVFWLSTPDKDVYYVSSAFQDIWGFPPEDLYEDFENFIERIHPEDRDRVKEAILEDQVTGDYDEEYRIVRPDGEVRWIHDQAYPIEDDSGEVVRIAGIAEDITERKQLRQERDEFFDLAIDMICVANLDGYFLDVNPSFSEVLGYNQEELLEQPFLEFVHPEDVEETEEVLGQLKYGEEVRGFENRYLTKEGEVRWFNWNATAFGERIYAVARDTTKEHRYREQLEQALEEKEVLLEEVHHRVKNNLQVISSLLDMQSRQIDDDETLDAFRDSVARIRSMALIHEKLYQTGSLEVVDLEQYLNDLCEYVIDVRSGDKHEFISDIEEGSLSLDKSIPLGMIVNELVSNALEHGLEDKEGGTIEVEFHRSGDRAELLVSDNGTGLPEDLDPLSTSTVGMKIIRSLTDYELNGELEFIEDDGLTVKIEFEI